MAVYKQDNGKWLVRISYRDETSVVRSKKKTFETKREAQNYETDFLRGRESKSDNLVTFNEVFEEYLKLNEQKANKETIAEKRRVKLVFFEELSEFKFSKITKKKYLDVWVNISKMDYSIAYRNKGIAQLKSIAQYAYLYYDITNSAKLLEPIRKVSTDHKDMQVWTEQEFQQFNEKVESETLKAYFHFLYYTGARRGEALALQKKDIIKDYARINKSIKHSEGGFIPLKTVSSKRDIQLDKKTLDILKGLKKTEGDFLFGGTTSIGITTIQRAFSKGKKLSGVKDIRLHDLRHSHASLLLNKGANIVAVSRRLGHSDVSMTLKVYTHLMKESQDELLGLLES